MSRLTEKVKNTDDYIKLPTKDKQEFINKLGRLEDLEEEIGCPLDIRCRVVTDSVIYDENGVEYKVVYVDKEHFDCEDPFDNDMGYTKLCAFDWEDYKKTFWLKEDKSE